MESFVTIASFSNPIEANLLKGKIEAEGIPCFLADENTVTLLPLYSFAFGQIKLKVHQRDLEHAKELLNKAKPNFTDNFKLKSENESILEEKCPNCFSINIYKQEFSKKSLLGFLFLGFPVPILKKRYHCFDCGFEWKQKKDINSLP